MLLITANQNTASQEDCSDWTILEHKSKNHDLWSIMTLSLGLNNYISIKNSHNICNFNQILLFFFVSFRYSKSLQDTVLLLMKVNPAERPFIDDVIQHIEQVSYTSQNRV